MTLQNTIPSYLYAQYSDDDDLQAFVASYNTITQKYVDTFNQLNLPIYTGLSGALLDWVGQGVYGYPRPTLPASGASVIGPVNTYGPDFFVPLNTQESTVATNYVTTDDIYKRLLTWHFYKGDGKTFNIEWFKRRIKRFLIGSEGTAPFIDQTYDISVNFSPGNVVDVILPESPEADILISAIDSGAAETPFQYSFNITTSPAGSLVIWLNNTSNIVDWENTSSSNVDWVNNSV